jgi:hypothetical protein
MRAKSEEVHGAAVCVGGGQVAPGATRSLVVWRHFETDADGSVFFIQKLVESSDGVEERTAAVN